MSVKPSGIDTSREFVGSAFRESKRETIARNLVVMSQTGAWANDSDEWLPFSRADYEDFRQQTSRLPFEDGDRDVEGAVIEGFVTDGFLAEVDGTDQLQVTDRFLDVIVDFRTE